MIQEINEGLEKTHISMKFNDKQQKIIDLVQKSVLPKLCLAEDRPYTKDDFENSLKIRSECITYLSQYLNDDVEIDEKNEAHIKYLIAPLINLSGENIKSTEWTNAKLIQCSYEILNYLKKIFNVDSISKLFHNYPEILKKCLTELHHKLDKKSWKHFPGAQCNFEWILRQVSSHYLSQNLQEFLPFSLRFLDDWENKNKLFAILCIDYVVENVKSSSDLSKFGYTDVLKSVLFHTLNFRDVELTSATLACLYKLLEKCYGSKNSQNFRETCAKFNTWDELAQKLLYTMQIETQIEMKRLYIKQLKTLLQHLDLGLVRWLTTLLQVICIYTEFVDYECRKDALENLLVILDLGKERIKFHADVIFELLIRLLYEISQNNHSETKNIDDEKSKEIFSLASQALLETALLSPNEFRLNFDSIETVSVNESFDKEIHNVLFQLEKIGK